VIIPENQPIDFPHPSSDSKIPEILSSTPQPTYSDSNAMNNFNCFKNFTKSLFCLPFPNE